MMSIRRIGMALTLALSMGSAGRGEAAFVVNFDNLGSFVTVPDGYGGINWGGQWTTLVENGYPPHSPPNVIYDNAHTTNTSFSFVTPEVFDGAWFSGFNLSTVSFEMFRNGNLVFTSASLSPSQTPTFLNSGYGGLVDTVVVHDAGDAAHYVMDDVTYEVAAVPEPPSLIVAGSGCLMGLIYLKKKRPAGETG